MNSYTPNEMEEFVNSYVQAMLWATRDETLDENAGECLDANYSGCDIDSDCFFMLKLECENFIHEVGSSVLRHGSVEQMGHDFYLTRYGHGCGFFSRKYPKHIIEILVSTAKKFEEHEIWAENGTVYIGGI